MILRRNSVGWSPTIYRIRSVCAPPTEAEHPGEASFILHGRAAYRLARVGRPCRPHRRRGRLSGCASTDGLLAGTPTVPGSYSITVAATDTFGNVLSENFPVETSAPAPTITTGTLALTGGETGGLLPVGVAVRYERDSTVGIVAMSITAR
ncbi:hypothetical protein GCM10022198_02600 [Klugiella xanthotipulae]